MIFDGSSFCIHVLLESREEQKMGVGLHLRSKTNDKFHQEKETVEQTAPCVVCAPGPAVFVFVLGVCSLLTL